MKRGKIILIVLLLLLMAALIALVHYKRRSRKTSDLSNLLVFGRPDEGEWVLRLQKALNAKGYGLTEDGVFGTATERAVVEYFGKKTVTAKEIEGLEKMVKDDRAAWFRSYFSDVLFS